MSRGRHDRPSIELGSLPVLNSFDELFHGEVEIVGASFDITAHFVVFADSRLNLPDGYGDAPQPGQRSVDASGDLPGDFGVLLELLSERANNFS